VRSRLYFRKDDGAQREEDGDPEARTLTRMKANHAAARVTVKVRWQDGAFVAFGSADFVDHIKTNGKADRVFAKLMRDALALQQNVSPALTSHNYAPTIFAKSADRDGVTKKGFEAAMLRLLKAGAIAIETYGKPSQLRKRLVLG
jgi:hypothetical protein